MVGEVVAGILADSLALLSDAAHMLTDAGALLLSLIVLRLVRRPAGGNLTFGLRRTEILSAQANGATLLVLACLIVFGAIQRLITPPDPDGGVIVVVSIVGVLVTALVTQQLAKANRESMNIEGSFQHILTDLVAFAAHRPRGRRHPRRRLRPRRPDRRAVRRRVHAARRRRAAPRLRPRAARDRRRPTSTSTRSAARWRATRT